MRASASTTCSSPAPTRRAKLDDVRLPDGRGPRCGSDDQRLEPDDTLGWIVLAVLLAAAVPAAAVIWAHS